MDTLGIGIISVNVVGPRQEAHTFDPATDYA
jgi:hypothetical protein